MADEFEAGTVLIKSNTLMPEGLKLEAGPFVSDWRVVKDYDAYGLDRAIQEKGWTFFFLREETEATVFGTNEQRMFRRTVSRILARGKANNFNCLEITKVSSVGAPRFPWFRYLTVSAQWRHIQKSLLFISGKQRPGLNTERASISVVARIASDILPFSARTHERAAAGLVGSKE